MITSFAQSAKMHRSHSFIILVWFQVFRGQNQPHTVFSSRRHKYFLPWTVQFWWGWCLHQVFSPRFEAQPDDSMVGGRLYHRVPILLVFHKRYRFFLKKGWSIYILFYRHSGFLYLVSCLVCSSSPVLDLNSFGIDHKFMKIEYRYFKSKKWIQYFL